jgi:hypothetical protein
LRRSDLEPSSARSTGSSPSHDPADRGCSLAEAARTEEPRAWMPSGAGHDAMEVGRHVPAACCSCQAGEGSVTPRRSTPNRSTAARACWPGL